MKIPRKRIFAFAIGTLIIGAGAAFAYHNFSHSDLRKPSKFEPELAINGSELVVKAFRIPDAQQHTASLSFTGTLQPRYLTPVGFRVAGKIAQRHIEVGTYVQQGDLLFSLDPTDYEINLRVAEADLNSSQSTLVQAIADESRLRDLRKTNSVSASEHDAGLANKEVAKSRFDAAEKRLQLARHQLDYCELRADSDGLITAIQGETGQVVTGGQTVLHLMHGKELEAVVHIPETRILDFRKFKPTLSLWSNQEQQIATELREVSPIADPLSRTYEAKFSLINPPQALALGMTATIELADQTNSDISIPLSAIGNQFDSPVVWKIDETNGSVTPIAISIIRIEESRALVKGAIHAGDQIVSAGIQRIDGAVKVRVWNDKL